MHTLQKLMSLLSTVRMMLTTVLLTVSTLVLSDAVTSLQGDTLTPVGAEKAGNSDGTIPAWTGGLKTSDGAMQDNGSMADPFKGDSVRFTVTAKNAEQYKGQLTRGQMAMFKQYPDTFSMKVYPTRRSASYPDTYYQGTLTNAKSAEMLTGGNGLKNLVSGVPFPVPENGLHVIWNHMLRYRGMSLDLNLSHIIAEANGSFREITNQTIWNFFPSVTDLEEDANLLFFYKSKVLTPARMAGEVTLVHEPIDQVAEPRKAWKYLPGQRRVRRAPNISYDNPATSSDNLKTSDNLDMFNGAPDKYNWTLKGKKEIYIPYNSYSLYDKNLSNADIIQKGHLNPDLLRYELHRVWVVEATLKEGERHVYGKRTFYIDEDTWQIATVDLYDNRGELWRVGMAHIVQYNPYQVPWIVMEVFYDLTSGRYVTTGISNNFKAPLKFGHTASKSDYTPAAIRRWGK
ncbi:DUF1329 domain-containing protein [uncultured Endozoicomonas sp.]|uniref:DUF1329 domain-containing protein n=1 Tax=uncultured Endozoicomonas sp. TaxID=432652 RepID=UPI0026292086|nr:DUF1329 domain-containing protein [uncultured Endozoicomonas sp.]